MSWNKDMNQIYWRTNFGLSDYKCVETTDYFLIEWSFVSLTFSIETSMIAIKPIVTEKVEFEYIDISILAIFGISGLSGT